MVFGKGSKNRRNESSSSGEFTPAKKLTKKSPIVNIPNMAEGGKALCQQGGPPVDTALDAVLKELKEIKSGQADIKISFERKIDELGKKLATDLSEQCEALKTEFKKDMDALNVRVDTLETRIALLEEQDTGNSQHSGDPLENIGLTIVATNVFQHPEEDPVQTAKALITAMGKDNSNTKIASQVTVIAAKRLPNRNQRGPSLLKVSFQSLEEKKYVLRNKSLLRNVTGYEHVFLRPSMSHMECLLHMNFRTVLNKLPWGRNYRLTANGRIVERNMNNSQSTQRTTGNMENPGPSGFNSLTSV